MSRGAIAAISFAEASWEASESDCRRGRHHDPRFALEDLVSTSNIDVWLAQYHPLKRAYHILVTHVTHPAFGPRLVLQTWGFSSAIWELSIMRQLNIMYRF